MLGHNDIKTTLRYTRSALDDVRAAMEAVEKSRHAASEGTKTTKTIGRSKAYDQLGACSQSSRSTRPSQAPPRRPTPL
jgi:hypothetical protein